MNWKHPLRSLRMKVMEKALGTPAFRAALQYAGYNVIWLDNKPEEYIQHGYLYNDYVYSVINLITTSAVRVPWVLSEVKNQKALRSYKALMPHQRLSVKAQQTKSQALNVIQDHRIYDIWQRPNILQGHAEWLEQILGFKLLTGNSYVHGVGPTAGQNAGQFHELWPLPSQYITILPGPDISEPIAGYRLQISENEAGRQDFTFPEILHLKYWTPRFDATGAAFYGISPIEAATRAITRSNDGLTASARLLQNSGATGILSIDEDWTAEASQEAAKELKKQWRLKYRGVDKYGEIVTTGAKLKWQQIGLNAVDMKLLELEKADLRRVCNIYGIQSQLLNDPENKTYNNQKDARKALMLNVVFPELRMLADELNRWWIPAFGKNLYWDFDISAIPEMQEDLDKLVDHLQNAWWITGNEKREAMGYDQNPDPIMDEILVPAQYLPMGTPQLDGQAAKRLAAMGIHEYNVN